MNILEQGCTCESCMKITKQNLQNAKEKWDSGEREISFKNYHYTRSDGCCDEYGTNVFINGFDLNCNGEDAGSVIINLMEFLNIENVVVINDYDDV